MCHDGSGHVTKKVDTVIVQSIARMFVQHAICPYHNASWGRDGHPGIKFGLGASLDKRSIAEPRVLGEIVHNMHEAGATRIGIGSLVGGEHDGRFADGIASRDDGVSQPQIVGLGVDGIVL
jgi:hypothetical protein